MSRHKFNCKVSPSDYLEADIDYYGDLRLQVQDAAVGGNPHVYLSHESGQRLRAFLDEWLNDGAPRPVEVTTAEAEISDLRAEVDALRAGVHEIGRQVLGMPGAPRPIRRRSW